MKRKVQLIIPGLMALFFLLSFSSQGQTVITQWNFDDETIQPSTGVGTAANIGGTTFTWAGGVTGRGWNTSTYPAQSTGSGTAGVEFMVSTVGYYNIKLRYFHRASGTGSRWAQIHYTIDGGLNWSVFGNNQGGLSPHDIFYEFNFDFSAIPAANNNPDFGVRIVSIFSPLAFNQNETLSYDANEAYMRANAQATYPPDPGVGTGNYGASGTWRFDDVTISGIATYFHFGVVDGTRPAWMVEGGHTERGLTADATSVYVASRNAGTHVLVLNRLTGVQTGTLNTTGIEGGFWVLNDIEVSADGHRIGFNMFLNGGTFKAYLLDETDPVQVLFSTEIAAGRFGDKVTLVGSLEDGSAMIFAGNGSATQVLKWTMVPAAGGTWEFNNTPEVITLSGTGVASGATPAVAPLPDGTFYWSANGQSVHKFAADGTKIGTIPGTLLATGTNAMKFLGHEGDDEILAVFAYGANNEKAKVVRVVKGVPEDAVLIFDTPTLRGPGGVNPNGTGDVAFVQYPDGNVAIYVLSTNIGIGGYASLGLDLEFPLYTKPFAVTFNVNMTYAEGFDPATDVVYLTGSIFGWAEPGTDPDNQTMARVGDSMIWTKTVELEAGTYAYKYFLNAGWGGGEWDGGDDRDLIVEADMEVNDWFGYLTEPTFSVTFVIEDEEGDPIADAVVTLNGETNAAGDYVFEDLAPGTYAYTVVKEGYLNATGQVIVVDANLTVTVVMEAEIETFAVTFNVNMTYAEGFDPATDVVYLTGSIFGWAEPGTQPENQTMSRVGESMVWTKMVELEAGTYAYKYFLNAGWGGGEWPGGDDRVLEVEDDMEVNDWFGSLTDPTTVTDPDLEQIRIFPVPARTTLYITSPEVIRDLRVIDMLGHVVYASNVLGESHQINVASLRNGIYFVQILTQRGVETRKIQVQN